MPPTRLVPLATLTDGERAAWGELAASAVEPNPFFEPAGLLPAVRHLGGRGVELLIVADGDRWLGAVPVRRLRRWRRLPGRALATWRHPHCYLGTPLVAPGAVATVAAALTGAAADHGAASLVLEWVHADGPVAGALHRAGRPLTYLSIERAALRRREAPTYLDETVRGTHRKELRRLRRVLGRELGSELRCREHAGMASAVESFLDLESAGWKRTHGTSLRSVPGHAEFFRELCTGFAADGRLRLLSLEAGDRSVAMKCDLIAGSEEFCFKIAHDETLARRSPGVLLEVDAVEVFHADPARTLMDSCADADNSMINRLWPDRRTVATLVIPQPGLRGLPVALGTRLVTSAREWKGSYGSARAQR